MSNINTVGISGNLTRDPEWKEVGDGGVCELRVAVNRSKKVGDEWEDVPSYFDVKVWGGRGAAAARKLSKGSQVFVQGRLDQERWTNAEGQERSKVTIFALTVEGPDFFNSKDDDRELVAASAPAGQTEMAAGAADDDIPF